MQRGGEPIRTSKRLAHFTTPDWLSDDPDWLSDNPDWLPDDLNSDDPDWLLDLENTAPSVQREKKVRKWCGKAIEQDQKPANKLSTTKEATKEASLVEHDVALLQKLRSGGLTVDKVSSAAFYRLLLEAQSGRLQPRVAGGEPPNTAKVRRATDGGVTPHEIYSARVLAWDAGEAQPVQPPTAVAVPFLPDAQATSQIEKRRGR